MVLSLIVYSICTYYILKHLMQYNLQIDQVRFFNQTEQWYLQQPLLGRLIYPSMNNAILIKIFTDPKLPYDNELIKKIPSIKKKKNHPGFLI